MSFDPGDSFFKRRLPDSQMILRYLTNLVFDSCVKDVVQDHYHLHPVHITLQVSRDESILYVRGRGGTSYLEEDESIRDWALSFIAADVFELDSDAVDSIYLDGDIGQEAYLHIAGPGVLIASGEPTRKGKYL